MVTKLLDHLRESIETWYNLAEDFTLLLEANTPALRRSLLRNAITFARRDDSHDATLAHLQEAYQLTTRNFNQFAENARLNTATILDEKSNQIRKANKKIQAMDPRYRAVYTTLLEEGSMSESDLWDRHQHTESDSGKKLFPNFVDLVNTLTWAVNRNQLARKGATTANPIYSLI